NVSERRPGAAGGGELGDQNGRLPNDRVDEQLNLHDGTPKPNWSLFGATNVRERQKGRPPSSARPRRCRVTEQRARRIRGPVSHTKKPRGIRRAHHLTRSAERAAPRRPCRAFAAFLAETSPRFSRRLGWARYLLSARPPVAATATEPPFL